jgi:cholesterol transport system auxiliary component
MTSYSPPLSRRSLLALGASALVLAGCSNVIGPSLPMPQIYVLQPQLHSLQDAPAVSWQLAIAEPSASESLDTIRIALIRGQVLDYYANAQWTDGVTRLIQTQLVEAFENSGKIKAALSSTDGVRADYLLETEIRDFEARYATDNGAPTVVVDIVARLLTIDRRDVVATLFSHHEAPAARNDIPSVVAAFDTAAGAALEEIASWTLRQNAASPEQPAPAEPVTPQHHRRRKQAS